MRASTGARCCSEGIGIGGTNDCNGSDAFPHHRRKQAFVLVGPANVGNLHHICPKTELPPLAKVLEVDLSQQIQYETQRSAA